MQELILEWQESGQHQNYKIYEQQPGKNPGTVRIGRDPARCDLILTDPTVSGLHIEIFFHPQEQRFYIKNLRTSNPPVVDGRQLVDGEIPLSQSSTIYLGQMELRVSNISISTSSVAQTILIPPQPQIGTPHTPTPVASPKVYGLLCPSCHRTSPYEHLDSACRWCGTSLAAAVSALMMPSSH